MMAAETSPFTLDKERNYVTVTLCIFLAVYADRALDRTEASSFSRGPFSGLSFLDSHTIRDAFADPPWSAIYSAICSEWLYTIQNKSLNKR